MEYEYYVIKPKEISRKKNNGTFLVSSKEIKIFIEMKTFKSFSIIF